MSAADREHPSQADEALRRVIARKPETSKPLPTEPGARRRALAVRGW